MGEKTFIEWCDHTMNFWTGCQKVSPACDHCYAEAWAKRAGRPELWAGERSRTTPANWRQPHKWNASMRTLRYPRARVFTNSLADFFDNQVPSQWRREAWHVIDQTPNLDWLILTKRAQNIIKMLPEPDAGYTKPWGAGWPNVWLGMTAENQMEYDARWMVLRAVPALVHFVSYEPMLGDLCIDSDDVPPDWIIAGGESGPHARELDHVERRLRLLAAQCKNAGVAFFTKQMGGKRKPFPSIPEDLMVREWPGASQSIKHRG
jgi:protein gp37